MVSRPQTNSVISSAEKACRADSGNTSERPSRKPWSCGWMPSWNQNFTTAPRCSGASRNRKQNLKAVQHI